MIIRSSTDVVASLPATAHVVMGDASYAFVAEDYLLGDFRDFWIRYKSAAGMRWRKETFDCDNFAAAYKAQLDLAARTADLDAGLAVATMIVRNITTSLGIRPGPHALNLVGVSTATGPRWLAVEPQNQSHVYLENYHSAVIRSIHF